MTDQKMESAMGNLLRAGVVLAAAVVLLGAIVYLARHGDQPPDYRTFHGQPADMRSLSGVVAAAASLNGRAIIQLGVLLLIATPVARVAASVAAFAMLRDRLYVVFTLVVLSLLLFSLFGAH